MLNCSIAGLSMLMGFVGILWLITALLLIFIILIQKGKGGGLGGAFGGAGGGGGLLGTKTGDFLTWVTITLVFLFFFLAILLVKFGKPDELEDMKAGSGNPIVAPEENATPPEAPTVAPENKETTTE